MAPLELEYRAAKLDLDEVRDRLGRTARLVDDALGRVVQVLRNAGDDPPTPELAADLLRDLRRIHVPNAAHLFEAGVALGRAVAHAEKAHSAAASERDTTPGSYARQMAEEVKHGA